MREKKRGKKAQNFGPPPFGAPTLRGRTDCETTKTLGLAKNGFGQKWPVPEMDWPKMDWPKTDWPKTVSAPLAPSPLVIVQLPVLPATRRPWPPPVGVCDFGCVGSERLRTRECSGASVQGSRRQGVTHNVRVSGLTCLHAVPTTRDNSRSSRMDWGCSAAHNHPSCRKYHEAKHNYFGIHFQIASANLWALFFNCVRKCNCECDFLAHVQLNIFAIVSDE